MGVITCLCLCYLQLSSLPLNKMIVLQLIIHCTLLQGAYCAQSDAVYDDMNEIEDSTDIDVGAVTKLSGGLEVKILKKAKKCLRQASAGDNLTVNYVGRLHSDAGEVFDETKTKGFPFKFQLGGGRIIEGLERGMRGMCKGESRALLVPPELGYNGRGVPSGVVLHYVVDLLAIEDGVLDHLQEECEGKTREKPFY